MSAVKSMGQIDPESPERLRQCLAALAQYTGRHVLRVEVELGPSTRTDDGHSITMTVTHSLGPEHETAIGPALGNAFATTLNALLQKVWREEEGEAAPDSSADPHGSHEK